MSTIIYQRETSQQSLTITRDVFTALSPLDQIAARAAERCGLVQILEKTEDTPRR
jgi:hypothetical protein